MTLQEAYATLWTKIPDATRCDIDIDTCWPDRRKSPEVSYSVSVWIDREFYQELNADLGTAVKAVMAESGCDDTATADLTAIHDQVSALPV